MHFITYVLLIILFSGCALISSEGEKVKLVINSNHTMGCKLLGTVKAYPPYGLPSDWKIKLRNKTAELGGDTVFATPPGLTVIVEGEAFDCSQKKTYINEKDKYIQLEKLNSLYKKNILTKEEYEKEKRKILNQN